MAREDQLSRQARAARAARAAGIPARKGLSLSVVDRRRSQLWTISIFVVVAITAALAVFSATREVFLRTLQLRSLLSWAILVFLAALALAFLIYVFEKERSLRHLTKLLIEERVLSAALSNRLAEISALSEVGKAINTTLDLQDVFDLILSSSMSLLGGTEGSIMLLEPDRNELKVVSSRGDEASALLGKTEAFGSGVAGTVASTRRPMLLQGSDVDPAVSPSDPLGRAIYSSMSVPLVRGGDLVGVLNLNETKGKLRFSEEDLGSLGLFAEHAAIAIGNARLYAEQRETVSRLEELDRLKSDFVAAVSHELKTPLTAIIGASKTVRRGGNEMGDTERIGFLEMIERQANRLLRLVEDLLTTARIEAGITTLRREPVDVVRLAVSVIEDLKAARIAKDRAVDLEANPRELVVLGDETALQQVMTNLVENALKYSEPPAPVKVSVGHDADHVVIQVSDEGRGISREQVRSIFERFRQADSAGTRRVGGFGLGLFIVKNLVEKHGGVVDVTSEVGRGSTFTVRLPKRPPAPAPPPPPQHEVAAL